MKILDNPGTNRSAKRVGVPAIVAVVTIIMAGCASIPAPTEQFAVSHAAIASATRSGGNEYAPLELKSAMEKMERAEQAMQKENYLLAGRLAEQAQLDARLAETKTDFAKTQKTVDNTQESNRVLREEIKRTTQ